MSRLSTVEAHSSLSYKPTYQGGKRLTKVPPAPSRIPKSSYDAKNIYSKSSRALLLQKSLCEDYAGLIVSLCEVFPCVVGKYLNSHPIIFEIYSCFLGKKSDGW